MYDFESPDNPFRGYEKSAYVQESGYGKVAEVNLIALGLVGGVPALRQVGLNFQKARTVSLAVQGMGASVGAGSVIDSARQDKSYEEIGMNVKVGMVSATSGYVGGHALSHGFSYIQKMPIPKTVKITISSIMTEYTALALSKNILNKGKDGYK